MADPRFYENKGPFTLAQICESADVALPASANADARIEDVASLNGAGPAHVSFFTGEGRREALARLAATQAGFCFVPAGSEAAVPPGCVAIPVASAQHAFAAAAERFYPDCALAVWRQSSAVDPSARLGRDVVIGPGAAIGAGAEIGDRTRIGANAAIGPGVAIGRDCEIGSNATITHSYVGDGVVILSGAQIGNPGFGFASSRSGHRKMPQLGRVIIQDRAEIGACTAIDRGALGDTVIGEGTKIDNLVQIGHNTRIGRHCVIVGHVGISGSCELGDFVVVGGQVGIADHARIGDGARLAARAGLVAGEYPGGADYGGMPARPMKEWIREMAAISKLVREGKKTKQ